MSDEQTARLVRQGWARTLWVLAGLEQRLGAQVAGAVDDLVAQDVRAEWAERAAREGSNTIDDLIRLLWEPLRAQGFEFTHEKTPDGVQMRCTRCPLADIAREINGAAWMFKLTCATDEHSTAGFNPKIGFRRTKTLMEGDDHCDHFYFYRE